MSDRIAHDVAEFGKLPAVSRTRRKFCELADVKGDVLKKSRVERHGIIYPIALEAVNRLDAISTSSAINGKLAADWLAVR